MAEKILIVDDDLDTLRLVGLMLQRQGYEIVAASSGHQALTMAQNDAPDLILLDVMMPDLDGVEVTRRLRTAPATKDIPIIMFTAKTQVEDKIMGFEAGADDYLTKPTQPRELFAHVKAVLGRTSKAKPPTMTTQTERGYSIGVMAARGGLGVSTLVLNLGITIAGMTDKEVVVADFRSGNGTISLELGHLRNEGLNRLLQRNNVAEITPRVIEMELVLHASGVRFLLASPQPHDASLNSKFENFEAISRQLPYLGRYVLIDLGSSLDIVAERVIHNCDEVVVLVEPVPQTIRQTKMLLDDLIALGIGEGRISAVLVNRVRSGMQLSWSQVQDQLGHNIAVIFTPAPELAYQASVNSLPMVTQQPESLTAQQFIKLAEKVTQRK